MDLQKINIIGGGPAGLYYAILVKKSFPDANITIYERNSADSLAGWGVVINLGTVKLLKKFDPDSYQEIMQQSRQWSQIDTYFKGEKISVQGKGYISLSRNILVSALRRRCTALGIEILFNKNITDISEIEDCDLLVGADGANSTVRKIYGDHFQTAVDWRRNRFCWLGTTRIFNTLTHIIKQTPTGVFTADGYPYSDTHSSFIPNIDEETWHRSGFESMSTEESVNLLSSIFEEELEACPLLFDSASHWRQFPHITNGNWSYKNVFLLGDALRTAHFTIGSGTRLAIEDTIVATEALLASDTISAALKEFEEKRRPLMERLQNVAFESMCWFEKVGDKIDQDAIPFVYDLMTRTSTLGPRSLRLMDPEFLRLYEEHTHNEASRSA